MGSISSVKSKKINCKIFENRGCIILQGGGRAHLNPKKVISD